jgi:SAM-dependent methyltransferase
MRRVNALVHDLVAAAELQPGARVIDYGCADQPYRSLFATADYVGVDLPGNARATVHVTPEGKVPLADADADFILSTQVLEHVAEPAAYLSECWRLLRPGGTLALTTHGVMYLHADPADYWRWTCDGLRLQVERAGFAVVEQRGVTTLAGAGLLLVQHELCARAPKGVRRLIAGLFQGLIAFADRFGNEQQRRENGFVIGVRAIRPAGARTNADSVSA